jgi:hypothetical protein
MRLLCVMMLSPLLLTIAVAQQPASDDQTMTSSCTFTDGNQVTLEYNISHKEEPQNGKVWMPGGAAMVLFAQTPLVLNNVQIPVGGYTMYVVPGKKTWSVIVSRNTKVGAAYDESQDLVHASLETAPMSEAVTPVHVSFAHMAPKECNLRLEYGKIGAFGANFIEQ